MSPEDAKLKIMIGSDGLQCAIDFLENSEHDDVSLDYIAKLLECVRTQIQEGIGALTD